MTVQQVRPGTSASRLDGPTGNERLTAWAGAALFVLLGLEGLTVLGIHRLMMWHIQIGLVLVGAVAVKLASTGYRFSRYYTGDDRYRRKGPPHPLMRILAPFLILLTVAVLGSGIGLLFQPPGTGGFPMLALHKASFLLWFGLTAVHVLVYAWRVPPLVLADLLPAGAGRGEGRGAPTRTAVARHGADTETARNGAGWRVLVVAVGIALGAVLAAWLAQRGVPWTHVTFFERDH